MGGGGVQRTVKFACYLQDHGWDPIVVAPHKDKGSGWHDESPLGLLGDDQIHRVGTFAGPRSKIARIYRRLQPIDALRGWSKEAYHHCVSEKLLDADVVITSGPPHSVHRAGYLLAKRNGMKWVADFRDHYTLGPEYSPISPIHRWCDERFETQILNTASAVICNTRTNRRELLRKFGHANATKIKTIYNGFDRDDLILTPREVGTSGNDRRYTYLYLGGLRGGRIDDTFFRMLEAIARTLPNIASQICFKVVGDSSRKTALVEQLARTGLVEFCEPVPSNALGRVLSNTDACVTWQRDSHRYRGTIAGKIFDYLAAEKPVYALGQENGEIANLLTDFGMGVCVNPSDAERAIQAFVDFHHQLTTTGFHIKTPRRKSIDDFSRQHQAKQLANVFDAIVAAN